MFSVGDATHILHRSEIVFGTDHTVQFGVRVGNVHEIVVEGESVFTDLEPLFSVTLCEILLVGLAAE